MNADEAHQILGHYLESTIPAGTCWIFVSDPTQLVPQEGEVCLHGTHYPIVPYENPIQLRTRLEAEKDAEPRPYRLILSQLEPQQESLVQDYAVRSVRVECTARGILESLQPDLRWSIEASQLRGEDFWPHLDTLQKRREELGNAFDADRCQKLLLTVLLDRDLLSAWDYETATVLQKVLNTDTRIGHLKAYYPRLYRYLESGIQRVIPFEEQAQGDDDFVRFMWTFDALIRHGQPYDIFLPRIFQEHWHRFAAISPELVTETCIRIGAQRRPLLREQIKLTEEWLTLDSQRFRLFNSCIGVDAGDPSRTLKSLLQEHHFCVPVREGLRILAHALVTSPGNLPHGDLQKLVTHLQRQHVMISEEGAYLHMQGFVHLFGELVELANLLYQAETWNNDGELRTNLRAWADTFYPGILARLEHLRDRIDAGNHRHELLALRDLNRLGEEIRRTLERYNHLFRELVATTYPDHLDSRNSGTAYRLWEEVITPYCEKYRDLTCRTRHNGPKALVLVLENLRWDGWELLRPHVLRALQGKLALDRVLCLAGILPTIHSRFLETVLGWETPSGSTVIDVEEMPFTRYGLSGRYLGHADPERIQNAIDSPSADVLAVSMQLFRPEMLGTQHKLAALYDQMMRNFASQLDDLLARLPDDILVFLCSAQGMVETEGQGRLWMNKAFEVERRFVRCKGNDNAEGGLAEWTRLNADAIEHAGNWIYFFAGYGQHLAMPKDGVQAPGRYTNGGISIQEMLLPCAIFVPKGLGQLEMF